MHKTLNAPLMIKNRGRRTEAAKGTTSALPPSDQRHALVVDDDSIITRLLSIFLGQIMPVETAVNGNEALQKVRQQHYDVIVSDIEMPVLNGIDFYRHAALSDPSIRDRFLFISGSVEEYEGFFRENNLRYYPKPVSFDELKDAVVEILRQNGRLSPHMEEYG